MATTTRLMTAAELLAMPGDDLWHELVKGELTTAAPAGFQHGAVSGRLFRLMSHHAFSDDLGLVVSAETGFFLERDPDTVRAPDVAFIRKERVPAPEPAGFFDGAPDIAVEVVSPSDTLADVDDKVADYLDAGAAEVWILNPRRRTLTRHARSGSQALDAADRLDGGAIFPGFAVTVGELFT